MTDSDHNQSIVHELAAFVPQIYRQSILNNKTQPDKSLGAVLFADISGFTKLTRLMSHQLGRQKGAEALLAQINPVYQSIINELHQYSGSVINFVGDGILCWFDDEHGPTSKKKRGSKQALEDIGFLA